MKTKEQLERIINDAQKELDIINKLHDCGVPYNIASDWEFLHITSGYKMGEYIDILCGKNFIERIDKTEEYAKSCKFKAKHGYVRVEFNKKQLREYVELCKKQNDTKGLEERVKLYRERQEFIKNCINTKLSKIKELIIY